MNAQKLVGGKTGYGWRRWVVACAAASFSFLLFHSAGTAWAQDASCLDCHEVDVEGSAFAVHSFLECQDCHPQGLDESHMETGASSDCSSCHEQEVTDYQESVHGQMAQAGLIEMNGCSSCHGDIHVLLACGEPGCQTNAELIAETCGACHADPELLSPLGIRLIQPIEAYTASVHARALAEGRHGASCTDCHGTHAIFGSSDPRSAVHHQQVPHTCESCHEEITAVYEASVHGRATEHGIEQAPVCTDCHGEHRILEPQHADSTVYPTNIPKMACGRCHGDLELSRKFGMPEDMVPAYEDSYHGLASRYGILRVANCSSCHGVHDIRPSSDPQAHTHPENLSETCGQCHPGAGARFAIGPVHAIPDEVEHASVFWVRNIYIWLIILTIGGMLLHNFADIVAKARRPLPRPTAAEVPERERMSWGFRVAHGLLVWSFLTLIHSGFALKYPEAWWSNPLPFWDYSVELRAWWHRLAALVMLAAAIFHLVHLVLDRRARVIISGMVPNRRDWTDLKGRLEYFLGRREHPPKAAWLSYGEKMEYLAVVWGTVIMVVSGFMLWFETPMLRMLPSWALDLATVVHLYEAILASLAILVWHFYAVLFDPLVYPMDMAWLTGKSSPARELEREDPPEVIASDPDAKFFEHS